MKRFVFVFLIVIIIASGVYWYSLKKPEGKIYSSATNVNQGIISTEGLISFISDRDGNDEIYLINQEGSFLKRITNSTQREFGPVLSSSKNELVYFVEEDDYFNIWLFLLTTEERRLISITRGSPRSAKLSPNAHWLALLEDSSKVTPSGDLFIISLVTNKTERVAVNVQDYDWTSDSTSIIYTQNDPANSITDSRLYSRNIIGEEDLMPKNELFHGAVAPIYLKSSKKILLLDVTGEFLRLVSMTLRGEKQTELFKIKIRPQENTDYFMEANSNNKMIILKIFSEQLLLESLLISLEEQTVKKIELETDNLKWGEGDSIIFLGRDNNNNTQIWIKENPAALNRPLTKNSNNWL